MTEILSSAKGMMICIAIVAIIVFLAMMVDLAAGLYKAYLRGDARRSEALKRTGYKFCLYEGSILIAAGVDMMVHMAKVTQWFGWDLIYDVPLVTIVLGIFWCVVEFLSVREKADEKTHSDIAKAEKMAVALLKIVEAMRKGETPDTTLIEELGKDLNKKDEQS
jgi:hypothetical protein